MIIPQKYLAVNWADGMKVNKSHFINNENYYTDTIRDMASVQLNNYNYGLLPSLEGGEAALSKFTVSKTTTNQVQIHISRLQAVTPGGVRISILNDLTSVHSLSDFSNVKTDLLDGTKEEFYVLITVNPFEQIPFGSPDPEEVPIRQPQTQPKYEIQLVNAKNVNVDQLGGYILVIGRIIKQGESYLKDEDFIAPCTTINSDAKLISQYISVGRCFNELQNMSLQIIQKILFKNQQSKVAQNVKLMCETVLNFCNQNYFYFRNIGTQQAPIFLVNAISIFSNYLYTAINILPENEKEELLNYFFEWSDVTPINFQNSLAGIIEINYNHYKTGSYLHEIQIMLNNVVLIWQKLNMLEFIGQHKENIVVKQEVLTHVVKEKKGWSILD
ncbi:hypothetical protein [Pedobacter punctiformis]|uniref:Type VI secretion system baseplate subunit TssK n=1 Tax=Pedobacter punctiformis TaxID=3004097 RepID=A0ABT4L3J3_9SPHI|nr:hypothetical protein [Pedobacter sp. HCMS5-2]MCZ4242396.1 hypothetical protein [Pedobacter sp. HCMS5-2]